MKEKFKPIDKKDLPKLIGLVVLAVVAFVFALFHLAPTTSASSARPKTAAAAGTIGTGTAAKTATRGKGDKTAAAADTTFFADDIAVLTSGKDPFVPNGPAAALDLAAAATAAAAKPAPPAKPAAGETAPAVPLVREITPPATVAPPRFSGSSDPSVRAGAKSAPGSAAVAGAKPVPVLPPPPIPPAYVVTGVVRGQNPDGSDNIAVLRGGAAGTAAPVATSTMPAVPATTPGTASAPAAAPTTERRFVRTGDTVGNGFVVVAVRRDGVTLAHRGDKSRVTLTLGENSRAK